MQYCLKYYSLKATPADVSTFHLTLTEHSLVSIARLQECLSLAFSSMFLTTCTASTLSFEREYHGDVKMPSTPQEDVAHVTQVKRQVNQANAKCLEFQCCVSHKYHHKSLVSIGVLIHSR